MTEPVSPERLRAIVFSKDRPLQLDATLRSLAWACGDRERLDVRVLVRATTPRLAGLYDLAAAEHPWARLVPERGFRETFLEAVDGAASLLFAVDDCVFVRPWRAGDVLAALARHPEALGFSLRLGRNVRECYALRAAQPVPPAVDLPGGAMGFAWPAAVHDFAYPLELSSSCYRAADLAPLLATLPYRNPNELEAGLAARARDFAGSHPVLLAHRTSVAFCAPLNVVQSTFANRCGARPEYAPAALEEAWAAGRRFAVEALRGHVPRGCHEEVAIPFTPRAPEPAAPAPAVSVIVPTWQRAGYLGATLDSLLGQSFRALEVLVADDGSTDGTRELVAGYAARDARVRLLALPHAGEVAARNAALAAIHPAARFVMNHDSDDLSEPTKLERLVAFLEAHPEIAVVGCRARYFDDAGADLGEPALELEPERIRATFGERNSMIHSAALMRREVPEGLGGYREAMRSVDDYDLFARALAHGFALANVPEVLHRIRLHPGSVCSTRREEQRRKEQEIRRAYAASGAAAASPPPARRAPRRRERLRLLHTVEFYAPHVGGAEEVVRQVSERLARRGHEVTVATTALPERPDGVRAGVQVVGFDVAGSLGRGLRGEVERYLRFVEEHPADVVMSYACQQWATDVALAAVASQRARRAHVLAPCGYSALADDLARCLPGYEEYFGRLLPAVVPLFDAAVYHSATYRDARYADRHGFANGVVIPNGAAADEFLAPPGLDFRGRHGLGPGPLALCVANFVPGKGQERVLAALRALSRPDVTAVFIGRDRGTLAGLRRAAEGLPRVLFLSEASREETVAAFHAADLFLFGSELEMSPLVLVEAMASRTPWISTPCGNVAELPGGVVSPPEELAAATAALLDDPTRRARLAAEGLAAFEGRFEWERVVDRYEDVYLRAAHAARARRTGAARPATALPAAPPPRDAAPPRRPAAPRPGSPAAPVVSVVVPCYQQAHLLRETVASVALQTFTDWELTVVDDGSPDDPGAVVEGAAAALPGRRVHLLRQANAGLARARNAGVAASRGRYVLPLDADDLLDPAFLERTVAALEAHPEAAIATTDAHTFGAASLRWDMDKPFDVAAQAAENRLNYCSLYRREVFDAVGGYNPNMEYGYEDWDFWLGAAERGFRKVHVPEVLFYYRVKPGSMVTEALRHHDQLRARLVLNHPGAFPPAERARAEARLAAEPLVPRRAGAIPGAGALTAASPRA